MRKYFLFLIALTAISISIAQPSNHILSDAIVINELPFTHTVSSIDSDAANLENADLRQANFYLTDLTGARLVGVNLRGARWSKVRAELANFCNATMPDGTTFRRSCFDPRQSPDQLQ